MSEVTSEKARQIFDEAENLRNNGQTQKSIKKYEKAMMDYQELDYREMVAES